MKGAVVVGSIDPSSPTVVSTSSDSTERGSGVVSLPRIAVTELAVPVVVGGGVLASALIGFVSYRLSSPRDSTVPSTNTGDEAYRRADEALSEADTAREDGNYETAIERYETAIHQYETAREQLSPSDERTDTIESTLSTTRETLTQLRGYVETHAELIEARSEVTETLTTAESDLQTAITGQADGEVTVPELRYRQARDRYEKVLDTITDSDHDLFEDGPIEITRDTATVTPPRDIEHLPAFGGGRTLADAGIDSAEAFGHADDDTLSSLVDVHRMIATAWWDSEVTTTFASRADIETRREIAQQGFDQI